MDTDILKERNVTKNCAAAAAILNINLTSYPRWGWTDLDEFWQPNAEWHAEYGDVVKIESGSGTPIWRTAVITNRK